MMTRQQIRQFLAVVETGSFTQAAKQVGVAQPSLSSGIRQLEEQVGAQLFERVRPTVRLTAAANRLLPIAQRIDREFKRAEIETARSINSRQDFVLGIIPTIPAHSLAKVARKFGPAINLREKPIRQLLPELRRGLVDAVVGTLGPAVQDGLHVQKLWSEPYMLMVSARHHFAVYDAVSAHETADEVMIVRRGCEYLRETSKFFTDCGVRPRFSFKSMNDEKVMALVRAGLGVTVAPQGMTCEGVKAVWLRDFDAARTIAMFSRSDDFTHSQRYREKIESLANEFKSDQE